MFKWVEEKTKNVKSQINKNEALIRNLMGVEDSEQSYTYLVRDGEKKWKK